MTVTIVEEARPVTCRTAITGGVDTHADTHVAAALDPVGGLLGVEEFPATAAGYARLLGWLGGFGTVCLVGIEGTGSYGAGLARHITAAGIRVVEVDRSDRQDRRRQGKSDPLDAVSAARAAQSGRARGAPKGRDGAVEAIRTLMVARRSAAGERTRTINQARALVLTGPDDLRARFARHKPAALITGLAALRPRPGDVAGHATRIALRELGRRAQFLDGQLVRLDELIIPLVTARAPGLLAIYGAGPRTAALLLIAAGDHPERLRSEAAWAHLCGAAPIPASSGKVTRHRLNPGGDRQANHALWRIVFTRLGSDPATRAYAERRTAVLAATLSAHGSAAFDVDVPAGLGGDATLRQRGSGLTVVVAAEEAGEHVDEFEQQRVYLGLLVSGVLGAVAGDEPVPPCCCLLLMLGSLVPGLVAGPPPAQCFGAGHGPAGGLVPVSLG